MTEDTPGTERVERDLDHTRARLDATIDALQEKLSPGQIFDQAVAYLKEGSGAEFSRNLMHSVRDNPLPVTLVGIGLAWLMVAGPRREEAERRGYAYDEPRRRDYATPDYGAAGRSYTEHYPQPVLPDTTASTYAGAGTRAETGGTYYAQSGGDYEDLATKAREAGERLQREENETTEAFEERIYTARGSTLGLTRNAGETMSAFRERVDGALSAAAERFRRMREQAAAAVSSVAERGRSAAESAYGYGQSAASGAYGYGRSAAAGAREGADYAARQAREMSTRTASYLQDQPLVLGAIGVTVGAALGLLVPPTRYERELFGGVRETMRDQARTVAGEVGERVSRVAEAVVGTAQEAAQREGLVGADVQQKTAEIGQQADQKAAELHGQVRDAAGRVRSVIEETVSAGRAAVERELSGGEGQQGGEPGSEPNRTT